MSQASSLLPEQFHEVSLRFHLIPTAPSQRLTPHPTIPPCSHQLKPIMHRSRPRLWTSVPQLRATFPRQSLTNHQIPTTAQRYQATFHPHSWLWDPSTRAPPSHHMSRHRKTTFHLIHPPLSPIMPAPPAMLHPPRTTCLQINRHQNLIRPHWHLHHMITFLRILQLRLLIQECLRLMLLPPRNTCLLLTPRCLHRMNRRQRITCRQIQTI